MLPFGKRCRLRDAYTCVSFASYVIGMDDIRNIGELEKRLSEYTVYEGGLNELIEKYSITPPENDDYYDRKVLIAATKDLMLLLSSLLKRSRRRRMIAG